MKKLRRYIRNLLLENSENEEFFDTLIPLLISENKENINQALDLAENLGLISKADYQIEESFYTYHVWGFYVKDLAFATALKNVIDDMKQPWKFGNKNTTNFGPNPEKEGRWVLTYNLRSFEVGERKSRKEFEKRQREIKAKYPHG